MSLEFLNWPYYQDLNFLQKWGSFDDVTQKFDLPLLSEAEILHKIQQFCFFYLKFWTAPTITGKNFS